MIHFDDWLLTKDEGPVIARQYDNLTRRLEILGDIPEGWSWTLLVQADREHLDLIALRPMEGGLGVDLTAEMLALSGYYTIQLRGNQGELVRHTNQVRIFIPSSLSGDANWPELPSEFSQAEADIRELNAHPPIPGDGGYWLVWDLDGEKYVTSSLPLPDVSVGPPGPQGPAGLGVPPISGPEDAGKVPTVNGDGTGYVLWNMESEKNWTMLSDFSIAQPEDTALFKFDGIIAKEFVIFFYGVLNNVDHDAPGATGLVDIKLNGKPYGRFSAYIRAAGGYDSIVKMYRVGNYNFFERSTLEGPGWGQYKTVERGYPFTVGEDINTIELIPENSMVFLAGAKIGLWYK